MCPPCLHWQEWPTLSDYYGTRTQLNMRATLLWRRQSAAHRLLNALCPQKHGVIFIGAGFLTRPCRRGARNGIVPVKVACVRLHSLVLVVVSNCWAVLGRAGSPA